jgi:hypothetical protein
MLQINHTLSQDQRYAPSAASQLGFRVVQIAPNTAVPALKLISRRVGSRRRENLRLACSEPIQHNRLRA